MRLRSYVQELIKTMNKLEHKDFEDYLSGNSGVSKSYSKLKPEEAPIELDRLILDESLSQVSKKQIIRPLSFMTRLDSPLAMAAVLVLCVSLVLVFSVNERTFYDERINTESSTASQGAFQENNSPADSAMESSEISLDESIAPVASITEDSAKQKTSDAQFKKENSQARSIPAASPTEDYSFESLADSELEADIAVDTSSLESKAKTTGIARKSVIGAGAIVEEIKSLIADNHLEQARTEYNQFLNLYPKLDISDWFSEDELNLLEQ